MQWEYSVAGKEGILSPFSQNRTSGTVKADESCELVTAYKVARFHSTSYTLLISEAEIH